MTHKTIDLRSWALFTVSFTLGMLAADIVDYQWQLQEDAAHAVVAVESAAP